MCNSKVVSTYKELRLAVEIEKTGRSRYLKLALCKHVLHSLIDVLDGQCLLIYRHNGAKIEPA